MTKKKVIEGEVPSGFFIIINGQRTEKALDQWKEHFKRKNIKTVVIKKNDKYFLAREGKEVFYRRNH
jgi:hypothetical protein